MRLRWVIVTSLLMSACGAASEVNSAAPDSLNLFDETAATVESEPEEESTVDADAATSSTTAKVAPDSTSSSIASTTTTDANPTETTAPSTTAPVAATTTTVDPNVDFCQAASAIQALGTSVDLDDVEATSTFFTTQAELWDDAAAVAPAETASDVQTVATFFGDFRDLLAANEFNLFAVFEEVNELQISSGSDVAQIRTEQFIYANCEVEAPVAEQATAAFYGELLGSADDRTYLAELLASAEVFTLDEALCFVDQATPDVMHPLVGAPATPAQEAALSSVLSTCQLNTGL